MTGNSILGNGLKAAELSKELANFLIGHKLHTRLSVAEYGDGPRAVVSCLTDSQSLWSPVLNLVAYHVGNAHCVSFFLPFISSLAEILEHWSFIFSSLTLLVAMVDFLYLQLPNA